MASYVCFKVALGRVADVADCRRAQSNMQHWLHVVQLPANRLRMSPDVAQGLLDTTKSAMRAMQALDIPFTPKFHLWLHISASALTRGPPDLWGCWIDESLNSVLKAVAKASASGPRMNWAARAIHGVECELARRSTCKLPR